LYPNNGTSIYCWDTKEGRRRRPPFLLGVSGGDLRIREIAMSKFHLTNEAERSTGVGAADSAVFANRKISVREAAQSGQSNRARVCPLLD
jgi:hypothetical protein